MPLSFNPFNNRLSFIPDRSEIPGPPGEDGRDGKDGKDGRDGVDGKDGKDGSDGVDGRDGVDGKQGPRGLSLLHSYGPPDPDFGEPGEFCIDIENLVLYGPKEVDDWPDGVYMTGPPGPPGRNGVDGKDGKDGKPGKDGKDGDPGPRGFKGDRGEQGPPGRTVVDGYGGGALRNLGASGIQVQQN